MSNRRVDECHEPLHQAALPPPAPSTFQLGRQVPAMTLDPGSPGPSLHLPLPPVSMKYQGHFRICVYQRVASSGLEFCSLDPPLGLSWGRGY